MAASGTMDVGKSFPFTVFTQMSDGSLVPAVSMPTLKLTGEASATCNPDGTNGVCTSTGTVASTGSIVATVAGFDSAPFPFTVTVPAPVPVGTVIQ